MSFATRSILVGVLAWIAVLPTCRARGQEMSRLKYNNPGLVVDLGVGLWCWPLPMDHDGDGDLDLVLSCPDLPYRGIYVFENPGGDARFPVFKPGVYLGPTESNLQPSYVGDQVRVLGPAREYLDFRANGVRRPASLYPRTNLLGPESRIRANQWRLADYDGDDKLDLIVGAGDWADYGWDNAYDAQGRWTRGPLHGFVFWLRNTGTDKKPDYAAPVKIEADGRPIDTFGMPSPNLADLDGDGDLDILCGEFLDRFTYFENLGTRQQPRYAAGRRLADLEGQPLAMHLQMIVPVAIDWDHDGDTDLIVGDEDGRVALVEHTGKVVEGLPRFKPPVYFQQEADEVKCGALATPSAADWDGDGDTDLIVGNSSGEIAFFEKLDGGDPPRWAAPQWLESEGKVLRVMAGPNGSIQGPCEAKWGYAQPCVADWDRDGRLDLVVNSIWGKVVWYRNVGTRNAPKLAAAKPIEVEWPTTPPRPAWTWWTPEGKELATQWRTTPAVLDWTGDGLPDLVMLDHEGFLALFERYEDGGTLKLHPGRRAFRGEPNSAYDSRHRPRNRTAGLLQLNDGKAGASGRRTLCFTDWDGDGQRDLIVDSLNATLMRNTGTQDGVTTFHDEGLIGRRALAGHSTCPTAVDWNRDGVPDLVVGAEDGRLYYVKNPRTK